MGCFYLIGLYMSERENFLSQQATVTYRKIKVPQFLRVPKCYPRFLRTFLPSYVSSGEYMLGCLVNFPWEYEQAERGWVEGAGGIVR